LIFLALVIPLAVYCLVLSVINRRRHPVIVPGPWDFAGVLFAASGMLILGGPAILTGLYEQWRLSWLLGQTRYLQGIGENWGFWVSLWLLYFAVVAGGSILMLARRRALTSIYNVEPAVLIEVLTETLDRVGLEWQRHRPSRLLLRFREPQLEEGGIAQNSALMPYFSRTAETPVLAERASRSVYAWAELALVPFPLMRHVTLHWLAHNEPLRLEVETELGKALARVYTRENPASVWFLCVALGLFFSAFLALIALLVIRIRLFS
jgi:hypothetical protein